MLRTNSSNQVNIIHQDTHTRRPLLSRGYELIEQRIFHIFSLLAPMSSVHYATMLIQCIVTTLQYIHFLGDTYVQFRWYAPYINTVFTVSQALSHFPITSIHAFYLSLALPWTWFLATVFAAVSATEPSTASHPHGGWLWPLRGLRQFCIWLPTVFFLPIMRHLLEMYTSCMSASPSFLIAHPIYPSLLCWDTTHTSFVVVAVITSFLFLCLSLVTATCFYDHTLPNTINTTPSASSRHTNTHEVVEIFGKTFLLLLFSSAPTHQWVYSLALLYCGLPCILLVHHLRHLPLYQDHAQLLFLARATITLWTGLCTIAHLFLPHTQDTATQGVPVLYITGLPLVLAGSILAIRARYNYAALLSEPEITQPYMVGLHAQATIRTFYQRLRTLGDVYIDVTPEIQREYEGLIHTIIRIFAFGIARFPTDAKIRILFATFQAQVMHNRVLAYSELQAAESGSLSFRNRYFIFFSRKQLDTLSLDAHASDVQVYIRCKEGQARADAYMVHATRQLVLFWSMLLRNDSDIDALALVGHSASQTLRQSVAEYEALLQLHQRSIPVLRTYGMVLLDIVGDTQRALLMLQTADELESAPKYAFTQRTFLQEVDAANNLDILDDRNGIVSISVDPASMGVVEDVNAAGAKMFGYGGVGGLKGRNVNVVIPQPLARYHNQYISAYIERKTSRIVGRTRTLFFLHAQGHIIPAHVYIRWVDEAKGKFIGVVSALTDSTYAEATTADGDVTAIMDPITKTLTYTTANFYTCFGISRRSVLAQEVQLYEVLPALTEPDRADEYYEQMMGKEGWITATSNQLTGHQLRVHVMAMSQRVYEEEVVYVRMTVQEVGCGMPEEAIWGAKPAREGKAASERRDSRERWEWSSGGEAQGVVCARARRGARGKGRGSGGVWGRTAAEEQGGAEGAQWEWREGFEACTSWESSDGGCSGGSDSRSSSVGSDMHAYGVDGAAKKGSGSDAHARGDDATEAYGSGSGSGGMRGAVLCIDVDGLTPTASTASDTHLLTPQHSRTADMRQRDPMRSCAADIHHLSPMHGHYGAAPQLTPMSRPVSSKGQLRPTLGRGGLSSCQSSPRPSAVAKTQRLSPMLGNQGPGAPAAGGAGNSTGSGKGNGGTRTSIARDARYARQDDVGSQASTRRALVSATQTTSASRDAAASMLATTAAVGGAETTKDQAERKGRRTNSGGPAWDGIKGRGEGRTCWDETGQEHEGVTKEEEEAKSQYRANSTQCIRGGREDPEEEEAEAEDDEEEEDGVGAAGGGKGDRGASLHGIDDEEEEDSCSMSVSADGVGYVYNEMKPMLGSASSVLHSMITPRSRKAGVTSASASMSAWDTPQDTQHEPGVTRVAALCVSQPLRDSRVYGGGSTRGTTQDRGVLSAPATAKCAAQNVPGAPPLGCTSASPIHNAAKLPQDSIARARDGTTSAATHTRTHARTNSVDAGVDDYADISPVNNTAAQLHDASTNVHDTPAHLSNASAHLRESILRRHTPRHQVRLLRAIACDRDTTAARIHTMSVFATAMTVFILGVAIAIYATTTVFLATTTELMGAVTASSMRAYYMLDAAIHARSYMLLISAPWMAPFYFREHAFVDNSYEGVLDGLRVRAQRSLAQHRTATATVRATGHHTARQRALDISPAIDTSLLVASKPHAYPMSLDESLRTFTAEAHTLLGESSMNAKIAAHYFIVANAVTSVRAAVQEYSEEMRKGLDANHRTLMVVMVALAVTCVTGIAALMVLYILPAIIMVEKSRHRVLSILRDVPIPVQRRIRGRVLGVLRVLKRALVEGVETGDESGNVEEKGVREAEEEEDELYQQQQQQQLQQQRQGQYQHEPQHCTPQQYQPQSRPHLLVQDRYYRSHAQTPARVPTATGTGTSITITAAEGDVRVAVPAPAATTPFSAAGSAPARAVSPLTTPSLRYTHASSSRPSASASTSRSNVSSIQPTSATSTPPFALYHNRTLRTVLVKYTACAALVAIYFTIVFTQTAAYTDIIEQASFALDLATRRLPAILFTFFAVREYVFFDFDKQSIAYPDDPVLRMGRFDANILNGIIEARTLHFAVVFGTDGLKPPVHGYEQRRILFEDSCALSKTHLDSVGIATDTSFWDLCGKVESGLLSHGLYAALMDLAESLFTFLHPQYSGVLQYSFMGAAAAPPVGTEVAAAWSRQRLIELDTLISDYLGPILQYSTSLFHTTADEHVAVFKEVYIIVLGVYICCVLLAYACVIRRIGPLLLTSATQSHAMLLLLPPGLSGVPSLREYIQEHISKRD